MNFLSFFDMISLTVGGGTSYKLAKYRDVNMSSTVSTTTAKIGLLRLGELMSGQFDRNGNTTNYWTLTPFNSSIVWYVGSTGNAYSTPPSRYSLGVRPSMNLKSNVIITGGDGTKNNPFTLELAN